MTEALSLYLDAIRILAALAVLLDHAASGFFADGALWAPLCRYGGAAVDVFFVLSGYVIAHVAATRENTFEKYAIARISRLYSVVAVALPLTYVCDHIGLATNPLYYYSQELFSKPESFMGYLSALFFVNEWRIFDFQGIAPGTNNPYWSLSFEVVYYLVAALLMFSRRAVWIVLAPALLCLAGRTIAAMLPLWLCGFAVYHARLAVNVPRPLALGLFVASLAPVAAAPLVNWGNAAGLYFPWGCLELNRNITQDYVVAAAFSVNLLCARHLLTDAVVAGRIFSRAIRWLGSLTFPLYITHYPLLCVLAAARPFEAGGWRLVVYYGVGVVGAAALVARAADALKLVMRDGLRDGLRGGLAWTPLLAPLAARARAGRVFALVAAARLAR